MGKKDAAPKGAAQGWDIGKPPRTILHHVQARVNRRFCRKTASFVESGRSVKFTSLSKSPWLFRQTGRMSLFSCRLAAQKNSRCSTHALQDKALRDI